MTRDRQDSGGSPQSSIIVELAHPIYLDTPMLISFLAAVDDGVSFSSEVAEKIADTRKQSGEGAGEVKIPGLAALLGLSLSASGKYGREKAEDQSTESTFVRQHTAASLFNRLRLRMNQQNVLKTVDSTSSLEAVSPGDLVTVSGTIDVSPLETLVKIFYDLLPFFEQGDASLPQQELVSTKQIVELIDRDLKSSPIVDLVLRREGLSVVITASRESFSDDVSAALLGGTFTLVGKVTAKETAPDAETLVVRRGAMGLIANAVLTPMLQQASQALESEGASLDLSDARVKGPYIQVIPLAVYV